MYSKLFIALALVFGSVCAPGAITISGTAASNLNVQGGLGLVPDGSLWILVVSTSNATFGASVDLSVPQSNTVAALGSFGEADDIIVARGSTSSGGFPPGSSKAQINLTGFDATPYLSDPFALYWFPTHTTASSAVSAVGGDDYGFFRGSNWTMPAANSGTFAFGSEFQATTAPGGANLNVQSVPEPSRVVLLALALAATASRRRRGEEQLVR